MLEQSQLEKIIDYAMNNGASFAEVYQEEKETCGIVYENEAVDKISTGGSIGIGIRLWCGDKVRYAHSAEITEEGALKLVKNVLEAENTKKEWKYTVSLQALQKAETEVIVNPKELSLEEKIKFLAYGNQCARQNKDEIAQVSVSYSDSVRNIRIANSEGCYTQEQRVLVRMSCQVIATDGSHTETGYASLGGNCGLELFSEENIEKMAENSAYQASTLLHASPCPGGKMEVVLSSEAGGTMVHEACGHGLEGDLVQRGMSVYAGKIGEQVASEHVTVVDDGTIPGKYGSYAFDDEGHPAQKNVLIENGILKQYICDKKTALELGAQVTGNGRRESYRHEPVTRMTNTYIAPGKSNPEDIIKAAGNGLYVKHMGGGQVDTLTGNYVFDVSEGYMIRDGKIAEPVRGATLIGNGPESLRNIRMVGNDLGFAIGTCGKFGQGVPVGDAQPTLWISDLTVGGTVNETKQKNNTKGEQAN